MTTPPTIVCGFSANMEFNVSHKALIDTLPEGISHNKNAGCRVEKRYEGDKITFTVTLPKGDVIHFSPCRPHTFYAGSSVNIGSMALALGSEVHCWLTLGDDDDGTETYAFLGDKGIRVNNIECGATPRTVAVRGDGATTLLMQKPGPPKFRLHDEVRKQIIGGIKRSQPDIIFMTSIGETELTLAKEVLEGQEQPYYVFCPRISILGSGHGQTEDLLRAMAAADAIFINRREYRHLIEKFDADEHFCSKDHLPFIVERLAPLISDKRRRLFVVTCDVDGSSAIAYSADKIEAIHDIPAMSNARAVDTTGAGDAFTLGMMLGIHRNIPWKEAMEWGARLAAANIAGPGGSFAADPSNQNRVTPAFFDSPTT